MIGNRIFGRGANSKLQSLGWRCTFNMQSVLELGESEDIPPRKIFKNKCCKLVTFSHIKYSSCVNGKVIVGSDNHIIIAIRGLEYG